MITFFFGMPGSGKTSVLCSLIAKEDKKISRGKSKYKYIYVNFPVKYFKNVYKLNFDDIGKLDYRNALLVIDEGSVYCDNRNWKSFGKDKVAWFMLHRHAGCDVIIASQSYSGYDSKLRSITENVYFIFRRGLFRGLFSCYYRIPYGILIPDKKDNAGEKYGEIVEGYCKPNLIQRIFCSRCFRPLYYKHFDTYDMPLKLQEVPLEVW